MCVCVCGICHIGIVAMFSVCAYSALLPCSAHSALLPCSVYALIRHCCHVQHTRHGCPVQRESMVSRGARITIAVYHTRFICAARFVSLAAAF